MGLKLEFILTFAIVGIIAGALLVRLTNTNEEHEVFTKELEFINTILTEVDTDKILSRSYGTYGVHEKGVFKLENLVYSTDTIEKLVAKEGRFKKEILYLDGSVILKEKNGYIYKTEHANYDQETEILNITAPFTAKNDKNIIKGNSLRYDTRKKEASGTKIDSVLYTTEK